MSRECPRWLDRQHRISYIAGCRRSRLKRAINCQRIADPLPRTIPADALLLQTQAHTLAIAAQVAVQRLFGILQMLVLACDEWGVQCNLS
jgi:hypothetical protein